MDLPAGPVQLTDLPVVDKPTLMAAFDDWCTDRAVTRESIDRFVGERAHIGERFLGKYIVWMSSGSTGVSGIYVQDSAALAAYDTLVRAQLTGPTFAGCDWQAVAAQGGRSALITADTDHFASIVSWRRLAHGKPWLAMKSFAVTQPVSEIVRELNAYQPAFVSSYPTVLSLLAEERAAGRLQISPAALWSGGEGLSPAARHNIERAFGAPLLNEYGASECLTIGHGCSEGALHVNADWVILEPVDRHTGPRRPASSRTRCCSPISPTRCSPSSATTWATACARWPVPADAAARCPRSSSKAAATMCSHLHTRDGMLVHLVPLALTTVIEDAAHVHRFQVVQTAPDRLCLRLMDADRAGRARRRSLRCASTSTGMGSPRRRGPRSARTAATAARRQVAASRCTAHSQYV